MQRLLARGLKLSHLRLAASLAEEEQLSAAAARMGVAQPAASRLAAEIEAIMGCPLYARAGRGIALTHEGRALAQRAARILGEIDEAGREIEELRVGSAGRVAIGAVTGPAIEHVLPAVRQARIVLPGLRIEVVVGPSDQLTAQLRDGRIDLALARLPGTAADADFAYSPVGREPIALVVRRDHPLLRGPDPAQTAEILRFDWVMPPPGAILRSTVEAALREAGHAPPARVLDTSSFLLTLATISQTNAIAPIATSVAQAFESGGTVAVLPTPIDFSVKPYGLMHRAGSALTPAVTAMRDILRATIAVAPEGGPPG